MKRISIWCFLGFLAGSLAAADKVSGDSPRCKRIRKRPASFEGVRLEPGHYRIRFVATRGSEKGNNVECLMTLRPTSPDDRSSKTGEAADDSGDVILYGWLDCDLGSVGAPMFAGSTIAPSPDSQDPVYPGVLVHEIDWFHDWPEDTPVLTIGTLSNLRDGTQWHDGAGIGLWVKKIAEDGFLGDWSEWGVVMDGSGYFCAHPARGDAAGKPSN